MGADTSYQGKIQRHQDGTLEMVGSSSSKYARWDPTTNTFTIRGITKLANRPVSDAFALEVKSEFTGTATAHRCIDATVDWHGAGAAGGGVFALSGVARVAADHTMGGGSLVGNYAQIKVDGTIDGAAAMLAAQYALIEAGGTVTAMSHMAASWLDSHLAATPSAGKLDMQYITNNGAATFDDVFYVYGGNKINALFSLDTCGTMVVKGAGTYSSADGYICINVDGVAMRIPYFSAVD